MGGAGLLLGNAIVWLVAAMAVAPSLANPRGTVDAYRPPTGGQFVY